MQQRLRRYRWLYGERKCRLPDVHGEWCWRDSNLLPCWHRGCQQPTMTNTKRTRVRCPPKGKYVNEHAATPSYGTNRAPAHRGGHLMAGQRRGIQLTLSGAPFHQFPFGTWYVELVSVKARGGPLLAQYELHRSPAPDKNLRTIASTRLREIKGCSMISCVLINHLQLIHSRHFLTSHG